MFFAQHPMSVLSRTSRTSVFEHKMMQVYQACNAVLAIAATSLLLLVAIVAPANGLALRLEAGSIHSPIQTQVYATRIQLAALFLHFAGGIVRLEDEGLDVCLQYNCPINYVPSSTTTTPRLPLIIRLQEVLRLMGATCGARGFGCGTAKPGLSHSNKTATVPEACNATCHKKDQNNTFQIYFNKA
eukprot:4686830-Amphidinium_carterae.1